MNSIVYDPLLNLYIKTLNFSRFSFLVIDYMYIQIEEGSRLHVL